MQVLRKFRKPVAVTLIGTMTAISAPILPVHAALIGTDSLVGSESATEQAAESAREQVTSFLSRDDVRSQLETMGIAPEEARARVDALSDSEVREIAGKLDTLPAGEGIIGPLIGAALIVFLVLLITDLLGFTHVFGFTNKGSARGN